MIPSSAAYVDTVLEMMDAFAWRNIAVIAAKGGLHFHTAEEFALKVNGNDSRSVSLISDEQVSSTLMDLQKSRKRIVFASVEAIVAVQIICHAYQGVVWPNYTWIFPDYNIEDLLLYDMCDLKHALENAYLLQFHFNSSDAHTQYNTTLTPNLYAYAMHDSIQALALALNIQIRNGTATQVGSYNPALGQLVYDKDINPIQDVHIPRIKKSAIALPVSVITLTVTGVCIVFTTVMLVLFVLYRKSAEIKASSLKLSLFTFIGCYLLLFTTLLYMVSNVTKYVGPFFCTTVTRCAVLGIDFVYGTMLVRMLRVYCIFSYNGRMGRKRWSDVVLCIVVLIIVGNKAILLLIWSLVDVFTKREVDMHNATANHHSTLRLCFTVTVITLKCGLL